MTIHHFGSTREAYAACQCDEDVRKGDTLIIASEQVIGLADTWPIAVTDKAGELHVAEDRYFAENFELDRLKSAEAEAESRGWPHGS